ncbi:hypothetical protein [Pelagibacterium sp.]|uniref:hypothetical protein n=1 Tax=Pelagibacterium sp. TaxID=1967288 RepID=UPI003A8DFA8E
MGRGLHADFTIGAFKAQEVEDYTLKALEKGRQRAGKKGIVLQSDGPLFSGIAHRLPRLLVAQRTGKFIGSDGCCSGIVAIACDIAGMSAGITASMRVPETPSWAN